MSVVTFYGSNKIETAQTTSMAGIATHLSIEKNYKTLLLNTKYNDTSLQECFWDQSINIKLKGDLETGIGGLIKAIASNKTSPEIITNYTRTILKGRLELLTDYNMPIEDYDKQKEYMKRIIKMASKYYDLVFIDAEGSMEDDYIKDILSETNLIIANTTQRIKYIQQFAEERKKYNLSKKDNVIYLLGKYDKYSKYNVKNLQRLRRNKDVYGIPYNTLFFEACNEGTLVDFMIKYRKVRPNSMQSSIMTSFEEAGQRIIEKLKELQLHV